jgi:glutamate dehydrogenase (NADP+)
MLVNNGCICVCEGANMPCVPEAVEVIQHNGLLFAPGKAANAGGVGVSGLEMTQNAMKLRWPADEVDKRLHQIMGAIHESCVKHGKRADGFIDYVKGANIAGFLKVANTMIDHGII